LNEQVQILGYHITQSSTVSDMTVKTIQFTNELVQHNRTSISLQMCRNIIQ